MDTQSKGWVSFSYNYTDYEFAINFNEKCKWGGGIDVCGYTV